MSHVSEPHSPGRLGGDQLEIIEDFPFALRPIGVERVVDERPDLLGEKERGEAEERGRGGGQDEGLPGAGVPDRSPDRVGVKSERPVIGPRGGEAMQQAVKIG